MPNLTPIPLSVEEHEKLTAIKHRLEANSWREMMMKLCDIYEDLCKTDQPKLPTEQNIRPIVEKILEEKLQTTKPEKKKTLLDRLLSSSTKRARSF